MNRCKRCNRVLKNEDDIYGAVCIKKLLNENNKYKDLLKDYEVENV